VQIRGNVEVIEHTDHLLTTIALPDRPKRESIGEEVVCDKDIASQNSRMKRNQNEEQ